MKESGEILVVILISIKIWLNQILKNLLSNAFKYAFPNNRKGKITIELSDIKNNKLCQLKVSDNGAGISKKVNVNEPETLGLQLIHTLVQQMDGKVQITSEKGTEFLIVF